MRFSEAEPTDRLSVVLRNSVIARIVVLVGLLLIIIRFLPPRFEARFTVILLILVLAAAVNLVYLISLRIARVSVKNMIRLQHLTELFFVAGLIHMTGGIESNFWFLFMMTILSAGILLSSTESLICAGLSSGMFTLTCLAADRFSFFPPEGGDLTPEISYVWIKWASVIFAFFLAAFLGGLWSFRVRRLQGFQAEILDHMTSGFVTTDREGKIITFNVAAGEILGYSPETVFGKPVAEILRVASGHEHPFLMATKEGKEVSSYEVRSYTADGRQILLGITTSILRDRKGRPQGVIAAFVDVTEMERMRTELRTQDRLAAVGELSAGLAHEIRNPVAAIRGSVEELKNNLENRALCSELAHIAIRESDQLNSIVTSFLEFARTPPHQREKTNVSELLDETLLLLSRDLDSSNGLHIERDYPPDLGPIRVDRSQLKQALLNVEKNAVESMGSSGRLTIWAREDSFSHTVDIRVVDEGPGIPEEALSRIFEPFFTTKERGVGMGLPVVHKIITSHGGNIRLENRPGGGVVADISLPVADK